MMKWNRIVGTTSLFLVGSVSPILAQASVPPTSQPTVAQSTSAQSASAQSSDNSSVYATGKPLEQQSKEGFWGHMNPLARKKWVQRQIDPVRDRANELDELQAKNANDIHDVDTRAKAGISKAMFAASAADAHAADAASRADRANSLAVSADGKTAALNGTVSNLDQYQKVSALEIPFTAGHTALPPKGKESLDQVATGLTTEKGYIVEVQGYSKAGVTSSQAMADAVVRYLVTAHQVPVYRIYRTGLGKAVDSTDGATLINGVRVTVLHNSLASMPANASSTRSAGASVPPAN